MTKRLTKHVTRPEMVTFTLNGRKTEAYEAETLATAILLSGDPVCKSDQHGHPRAPFCNMGICYDCLVTVTAMEYPEETLRVRACMTFVKPGLQVRTLDR